MSRIEKQEGTLLSLTHQVVGQPELFIATQGCCHICTVEAGLHVQYKLGDFVLHKTHNLLLDRKQANASPPIVCAVV